MEDKNYNQRMISHLISTKVRHYDLANYIERYSMNSRPCRFYTGRWPRRWARESSRVATATRVCCRLSHRSAWSFQLPYRRRPRTWPVPDAAAHCPSPTISPVHPICSPLTCQVVRNRDFLRCYRFVSRMAQCPHPIFTVKDDAALVLAVCSS